MVTINATALNVSYEEALPPLFGTCTSDFGFTADRIFRRAVPPLCSQCGTQMSRNGYNTYRKRGIGSVKSGRYICPICGGSCEEDRSFWEELKDDLLGILDEIYQRMRAYLVSYRGRASIMDLIFPRGKDTISNAFTGSVESVVIPTIDEFQIVLYDEQHPKKGRTQKFRLTLLDGATGRQSPRCSDS